MKYETYSEYDPAHSALAESAFLTVWAGLGQWHDSLVLIGGMVPKYQPPHGSWGAPSIEIWSKAVGVNSRSLCAS